MIKYVETEVVFREIPDEITLAINISNCPCHCEGCHSSYLAEDIGKELTIGELDSLIKSNSGISTVSFMGGDIDPSYIIELAKYVKEVYPELKIAWYSGRQEINDTVKESLAYFDFIKVGPYIKELGPLDSRTTNQRFYKIINGQLIDTTSKFWKKV